MPKKWAVIESKCPVGISHVPQLSRNEFLLWVCSNMNPDMAHASFAQYVS